MLVESLKCLSTALVLLFVSAVITQLAGCADSPKANSNSQAPITILTENTLNRWISSSHFEPCGDPVKWMEVRVLWAVSEDSSRVVSADKIHDEILKYEREGWTGYWVSNSRTQAVHRAQKLFAEQGCDLLIIGDIISTQSTTFAGQYPRRDSKDVLLIRWERDDLRVN